MLSTLTAHDHESLASLCLDQIEQLRPITRLDLPWRDTFESEARRWRTIARGRRDGSAEQREALNWAFAHEFLLLES